MPDTATARRALGVWAPVAGIPVLGAWEAATAGGSIAGPRVVVAASVVAAGLLLAARIRRPLLTLVLVGAVLVPPGLVWGPSQLGAEVLAVVVAVFACGRYGRRPWAWLSVPFAAGLVLAQVALDPRQDLGGTAVWALNGIWIFGVGAWLRQKESLLEHIRGEAAERARAVAAEHRVRIARDLHDILAHSLSVMVVQAEVADELLDRDTAAARRAVGAVEEVGREALAQTRGLLGRLRGDDRPPRDVAAEDPPGPGLAEVPELVSRLRRGGLPVVLEVESAGTALPPAQEYTAFRLVQEGLTNTLRHAGPVPTRVSLRRLGNCLQVAVRNDPPHAGAAPPPGTGATAGHGLVGMRERVEGLGGRLRAGTTDDGGFLLCADLPLPEPAA